PALAPQDLGALDLELVLFRAEHVEAFAGLFERRLRLRESRVRLLDACPGLPGRGVEGAERETTLLERVGPLALLRGLGRELAVDGRHLVGEAGPLAARLGRVCGGPFGARAGRGEVGLPLGRLDLPAHALRRLSNPPPRAVGHGPALPPLPRPRTRLPRRSGRRACPPTASSPPPDASPPPPSPARAPRARRAARAGRPRRRR